MTTEPLFSMLDSDPRAVAFENRMLALFIERCWATLSTQVGMPRARSEIVESVRLELLDLAAGFATLPWLELAERLTAVHGIASAVSEAGVGDDDWRWVGGAIEDLRLNMEATSEIVLEWTERERLAWHVFRDCSPLLHVTLMISLGKQRATWCGVQQVRSRSLSQTELPDGGPISTRRGGAEWRSR